MSPAQLCAASAPQLPKNPPTQSTRLDESRRDRVMLRGRRIPQGGRLFWEWAAGTRLRCLEGHADGKAANGSWPDVNGGSQPCGAPPGQGLVDSVVIASEFLSFKLVF
jgi:hypothetical protein